MNGLEVRVYTEKDKTVLQVAGELDFSNINLLQQEIERQETRTVEIDCGDLQFMDSSGAGMLLSMARILDLQNRTLKVTHIPEPIRHDLEIIGFFRVLETLKASRWTGGN
ncbi:STAS domain-containing protein [Moorella sp. Hama-1]|uniref:STAS domain-containing protein n=1 Tax=Moorella sp. Hama-1 TaxID=2138101 RepID=UPI000D65B900|nr:STAS domain-containing protein [Moorella sp. Hama-1]BCV21089.1 anti-sigma factor antagonist [Moorella sp. Hama-1]